MCIGMFQSTCSFDPSSQLYHIDVVLGYPGHLIAIDHHVISLLPVGTDVC